MTQKERFKNDIALWTVERTAAEYNLICVKQSKLNKIEREVIIEMVQMLEKQGTLSYGSVKRLAIDILCTVCKKPFKTTDYKANVCNRCKTKIN